MKTIVVSLILLVSAAPVPGRTCTGLPGCSADGAFYQLEENGKVITSHLTLGWCEKGRERLYPSAQCVKEDTTQMKGVQ
jgi:hypothetical protein